ncbi:MAG: hypothetical protein R2856_35070 [Caldilineaceae bacterium]
MRAWTRSSTIRFGHPYTQELLKAFPDLTHPGERLTSILGYPPRLDALPPGCCRFAPRCPAAFDRCRTEQPPVYAPGMGHVHELLPCGRRTRRTQTMNFFTAKDAKREEERTRISGEAESCEFATTKSPKVSPQFFDQFLPSFLS